MLAGLMTKEQIKVALQKMKENVVKANAGSIGLTMYPTYPNDYFMNPILKSPYTYQNGGDWTWFGGRTIQALVKYNFIEEAYTEILPMVERILKHDGFYEWWTPDGQPKGSGVFRGSAGVMTVAIQSLKKWAVDLKVGCLDSDYLEYDATTNEHDPSLCVTVSTASNGPKLKNRHHTPFLGKPHLFSGGFYFDKIDGRADPLGKIIITDITGRSLRLIKIDERTFRYQTLPSNGVYFIHVQDKAFRTLVLD